MHTVILTRKLSIANFILIWTLITDGVRHYETRYYWVILVYLFSCQFILSFRPSKTAVGKETT
ncbi:hypothetical protein BDZ91DRAFT_737360 [Kalaharituber pfeilii]|nr:hypothetical protein BDZ91DRAFT_737360 [Kalaharituber pfeilii]